MKICALTFFRVLCFAFKYDDATYGEGAYFTALKPPPANSIAKLEMNNYGQDNQVAGILWLDFRLKPISTTAPAACKKRCSVKSGENWLKHKQLAS